MSLDRLVARAVELGLVAADEVDRFAPPPPPPPPRLLDEAAARRAIDLAHSGGWPDRLPRSPYTGRPMPAPPKARTR